MIKLYIFSGNSLYSSISYFFKIFNSPRFSLDFAILCDILCADKAERSRNNDNRRKDKRDGEPSRKCPDVLTVIEAARWSHIGKLYNPDFITEHFRQLLKKHKLKKIRFHDLRHSCASVLLAQGVPMKQIQEWLGHSDMSTIANIYSHLDAASKTETGAAMIKVLG